MVLLITLRIIRARNTSFGLVGNSVPVLLHLVQFQFARVVAGRPDLTGGPLVATNVLRDIALRNVWIDFARRALGVLHNIDRLLDEYSDAKVAHILNERGMRTGAGDAFDTVSVKWVRYSAKIKSLKERLLEEGWLTVKQVSARHGIDRGTINKRRLQGQIKARLCNDHGQWVYWLPEPVTSLSNDKITSVSSTAGDAV